MSATIGTRTIDGVEDRRIVLTGPQAIARPFSFGSNWSKLRIGIRMAVNWAADITVHDFAFGVCSGTSFRYGDASTTHFIGHRTNDTQGGHGLIYSAGPPAILSCAAGGSMIKKVGVTVSGVSAHAGPNYSAEPGSRMGAVIVQLEKNGSTMKYWSYVVVGSSPTHITLERLRDWVTERPRFFSYINALGDLPPDIPSDYATTSTYSVSFDEGTDGPLDCLNVFWSATGVPLEIGGIVVKRWATGGYKT